jgi:uncharacterized protein YycO
LIKAEVHKNNIPRGFVPRLLTGGVFMLVLGTGALFFIKTPRPPVRPEKPVIYEANAGSLKDGDIICRLGDRLWSLYFKEVSPLDKRFSHMGIIRVSSGVITVINAEGLGVRGRDAVNEVTLRNFLDSARSIGIYRLKNHDGTLISQSAMEYTGRPFDWQFDLTNDDKIYCTELLYAALKQAAPEIELKKIFLKELGKEIVPPESCSNSEYFEEVFYGKL